MVSFWIYCEERNRPRPGGRVLWRECPDDEFSHQCLWRAKEGAAFFARDAVAEVLASEVFYEGKLEARPALARQCLVASGALGGTGLRFLPVPHQGNVNASDEEAQRLEALVRRLINEGASWIDDEGQRRRIQFIDILIIAPHNAQVFKIQARLHRGACGHGGQVPGAGGAGRHLFNGHIDPGGENARGKIQSFFQ